MNKRDSKNKQEALVGDVFAVRQPDGRYGAIRIAKYHQEVGSYLIITTPYIGEELPAIENGDLKKILYQNRFFYKNKRALIWVDEKPPERFIYIGNIPLNDKEKTMMSSSFSENWASVGMETFFEWRWKHDQENFIKEVQEEDKEKHVPGSKELMDEKTFWSILSLLHHTNGNAHKMIVEPAINALAKMSVKDIKAFEETLSYKLYLLDTKAHARNMREYSYTENRSALFSVDLFLYARCAVVAEGQEYYELTIKNPEMMSKDHMFEPLLSVASDAYSKRRGRKFEYTTAYSYETFSNIEGWRD